MKVIRFSFDDVKEKPRQCQQTIQQLFGRWLLKAENDESGLSVLEKEAIRYAVGEGGYVKPGCLTRYLGLGRKRGEHLVNELVHQGWLLPASGRDRIRLYRLNEQKKMNF